MHRRQQTESEKTLMEAALKVGIALKCDIYVFFKVGIALKCDLYVFAGGSCFNI